MAKATTDTTNDARLTWNKARDIALIRSVRRGAVRMVDLLPELQGSPEFSGDAHLLNPSNVSRALARLRKVGVRSINLERRPPGGVGRQAYSAADIDELNAIA